MQVIRNANVDHVAAGIVDGLLHVRERLFDVIFGRESLGFEFRAE